MVFLTSNKRFLTIVLFKSSIEHSLENVMPNYRDEQKVVLGKDKICNELQRPFATRNTWFL